MMDSRKPLSSRSNLSRLPLPGGSAKKKTLKRARSPEEEESSSAAGSVDKRSRLDSQINKVEPVRRLASSKSVSNINAGAKTRTGPALKRAGASTANVMKRPTAPAPVTSRNISTVTAPRKTGKPGIRPAPSTVTAKPRVPSSSDLNSTVVSTGGPKKRPAWDLKGRLQDMEASMQRQMQGNSTLQVQLSEYNNRIAQLEGQNQKLSGDVKEKEMASETALEDIQRLRTELRLAQDAHESETKKLKRELEDVKFDKATLERQKAGLEGDLDATMKELSHVKMAAAELSAAQSSIKAELESTKMQLNAVSQECSELKKTIAEKNEVIHGKEEEILNFQTRERQHETVRRRLHNTVQELKGNIRVFCRVRPLLGDEQLGNDGVISHMTFPDLDHKCLVLDKLSEMSVNESVLNSTRGGGGRATSRYDFTFDRVFEPESSQADVFEEICQLVQSALDGYGVCIFAYGQTGSGKTFTMEGSLEDESRLGMIPRTVKQIFEAASELQSKGWQYKFEASMLEIYNETIRDLLGKGTKSLKHDIKMSGKGDGEVYVTNLTVMDVSTEEKVLNLLKKASENRAVAETKCNERSSRSHSVFQLRLVGTNQITGESSKGILNLVDLAGSERVKDSGSEGQRLVEAQSINTSLSNLGNVIMALGNKDKHVPYRNSKLTYLLQNSLGGNSKTLMFVNISPKDDCFSETLNSLRFATKVNQCNIGTAQKKK